MKHPPKITVLIVFLPNSEALMLFFVDGSLFNVNPFGSLFSPIVFPLKVIKLGPVAEDTDQLRFEMVAFETPEEAMSLWEAASCGVFEEEMEVYPKNHWAEMEWCYPI